LVVDVNLSSQFEAGKIVGEVLLDVLMLIGVGEAAVKFAAKLPELAKLAERFGEALKVGSRAGGGLAGAAAESREISKAASTTTKVISSPTESAVVRMYGKNTSTWITDAQGRTIRVEAQLRETSSGLVRGADETAAQRAAAAAGKEEDVGGHILGHRFMGDQGEINLFPQEGNFNNSAYRKMENELADWTRKGKEVHLTITLDPPGAARPDVVKVAYEVIDPATGETVNFHAEKFYNEAGQTFNRVGISDMEGK
jgi:hypothetical protein